MTTRTREERDAALMTIAERGNVTVPSLHPGGFANVASSLALGQVDDPFRPSRNKQGHILDWKPTAIKSDAGMRLNRIILQREACKKTKIPDKWVPFLVGPTVRGEGKKPFGTKIPLREAVAIMRAESPLELIPMDIKTYVRWDGGTDTHMDPSFVPDEFDLLSCASKRTGDTSLQMGAETLKLMELFLNGSASDIQSLSLRTRKEPVLGFQVPKFFDYTKATCTGKVLSQTAVIAKIVEARTGVKLYGRWNVNQTLVVKEHQLQDPDMGTYMIPVLHVTTMAARVCLGSGTEIRVNIVPEQSEINAMWREMFSYTASRAMREVWLEDDTWKAVIWGDSETITEERKECLSNQIRSDVWRSGFINGAPPLGRFVRRVFTDLQLSEVNFLLQDRPKKEGYTGVHSGIPIILMLAIEWGQRRAEPGNRKPATKTGTEDDQAGPNKRRRIAHENPQK